MKRVGRQGEQGFTEHGDARDAGEASEAFVDQRACELSHPCSRSQKFFLLVFGFFCSVLHDSVYTASAAET